MDTNCIAQPKRHTAVMAMLMVCFILGATSVGLSQESLSESMGGIWGKLDFLTNKTVAVSGSRYPYAPNVIIHTRDVQPDKRGNVKVTLNEKGQAIEVSLYGIEESDAMSTYFRYSE